MKPLHWQAVLTRLSPLAVASLTGALILGSPGPGLISAARAQAPPHPITQFGLNTQVNLSATPPAGKVQYDITGGTRPGGGLNLFHSFGEFGVPTNNIANFLNAGSVDLAGNTLAAGLPTSNILGRVTGGNASAIFGTIQTTNFGNANLFLMNPAGFLFGPNATVNVGGMVAFTSADYLKLTDNARFSAIPDAAADALLSASPVASFGFLGSNPGAITVQGSQFTVTEGTGILLVGGSITIQSGTLDDGTVHPARLAAPGGQINLASVASAGEVLYPSLQTGPNVNGLSFTNMGAITLPEGSILDVSADAAGTIKIRGGQFVIADATLSADTVNSGGASTGIDINLTGDLIISDTRAVPAITARTTGTGDAGEVRIVSSGLKATSTDPDFAPFALIDSHTSGDGRGGNVNITTGNLNVTGPAGTWHFIDSGIQGTGPGGDTIINAQTIDLKGTTISTGTQLAELLGVEASGPAGNLTFVGDSLHTSDALLLSTATSTPIETHQGGNITMNVRVINMLNTQVATDAFGGRGAITITEDSLITDATVFSALTALGPGGGITFNGRSLELTNGSSFITTTAGDFNAGDIHITATDHVSLIGASGANPLGEFVPSGLFSNSVGFLGTQGSSGNVFVTTPKLLMTEGRINTITETSGHGGNVTINAGMVSISGEFSHPDVAQGTIFDVGPLRPSGIFTTTIGNEFCSGPCGAAGNTSITTGSLSMGSGSQIDSGTNSTGNGGLITINASDTISMSGRLSDGSPVGIFSSSVGTSPDAGSGGNITLTAGQSFTISNGASVSASSTGPGNTGNIQIDAGNQFAMTNSSVTTQANLASGGTIKITTTPGGTVQLTNSTISASVLDGTGGGGSVDIDPQFVILQNSQILAQAKQGPGGNISITTNLLLPDANSVISASSGNPALNGTVTIQSPNDPAGGKIQPLGKTPLQATSLLNQRCAALAGGEFSSFTVAGRDSLPTEPGSWLASPLYAAGVGEGQGVRGKGLAGDAPILSLRQIAPAGFLTQAFAVDWSAGCQS